jgi:phosphatidylserine/phosphatidylglycerophosphate/cardiolipin synthase-like enzyme
MVAELERAESHVHIAGWYFSPDFALTRGGEPAILRDLLAELAERVEVRVLVWAGPPLPLFRPSRGTVRKMREHLCAGTKIRCALDAKERPMHCRHEKTIVVDDRVAFVGGIDLTSEAGVIASTAVAITLAARSAGTTRVRASRARRSPTSQSTSGCAGGR